MPTDPLAALLARPLYGLPIVVNSSLCDYPILGFRQRRTHHKKRINKKWLKQYGRRPIYGPCKVMAFQFRDRLMLCPHAKIALDRQLGGNCCA